MAEWDPLKLCVDVSGLGVTGYDVKDWLDTEHHLAAQLGDARRVVFSLTYADGPDAVRRLVDAMEALVEDPPRSGRPAPRIPDLRELDLEQVIPPRAAFFSATE